MKKKILLGLGAGALLVTMAVGAVSLYAYHVFHAKGDSFDSDGISINYFEQGRGAPVILVHGLGINAQANWMTTGVFRHLAKHYRVIALDLRGHGLSGKPNDPEQYGPKMAEDIVRLMDHLHIEKAHVVGYSLGGFVVLKLIALHPERLLSAAPCGAGWAAHPDQDLAFLGQVADDLDQGKGFRRLLTFLEPVGKAPNQFNVAFANRAMFAINDIPAITEVIREMKNLQVTETELRENKVPTLAVIGEKDPLKKYADQMAAVMANLTYVVAPGGNHLTTLFKPETTAALDRFLKEHSQKEIHPLEKAP